MLPLLSLFCLLPLTSAWLSVPPTDPLYQRQFRNNFQIKIPPSRQSQTDGFYSDSTSTGPHPGADSIYSLYNYQSIDWQKEDIKKVVIQIHGQARDAWAYFDDTLFALKNATARDKKAHDGRDKSSSSTKKPKSASTSSTRTNGNGRRTSTSSSHLHSSSSSSHHHSSSSSSSSSSRTKTKTSTSSPTSTSVSAPESLPQIKESEVLIFCPMFLNLDDFGAFPVSNLSDPFSSTSSALVWNVNDWMFGGDSVLPNDYYWSGEDNNQKRMENGIEGMGNQKVKRANDIPGISSFEVLDEVIAYFANSTNFPALETINVVGHSAGGQMVQRYALIGAVPSNSIPVHFTVANPGSYAYLTDWRPTNNSVSPVVERDEVNICDSFNDWKYGIGIKAPVIGHGDGDGDEGLLPSTGGDGDGDGDERGYNQRYLGQFVKESLNGGNEVGSIVTRYGERIVHYLFGTDDHGIGSDSCDAMTQGIDHLSRGLNFIQHLTELEEFAKLKELSDEELGLESNVTLIESRQLGFNRIEIELSSSSSKASSSNSSSTSGRGSSFSSSSRGSSSSSSSSSSSTTSSDPTVSRTIMPAYLRSRISKIGPGKGYFPDSQTVDWVIGVQHNSRDMFLSKMGLQRLFFINLDGEETPTAVGDDDKDSKYFYPPSAAVKSGGNGLMNVIAGITLIVTLLV